MTDDEEEGRRERARRLREEIARRRAYPQPGPPSSPRELTDREAAKERDEQQREARERREPERGVD